MVALLTILAAQWLISVGRHSTSVAKLTDHRVRVLVEHGRLRDRQLRICGITRSDLFAQLRQQGVYRLEDLRYVLYETKGTLTIVREESCDAAQHDLVAAGLQGAAGYAAKAEDGQSWQGQAEERGQADDAAE